MRLEEQIGHGIDDLRGGPAPVATPLNLKGPGLPRRLRAPCQKFSIVRATPLTTLLRYRHRHVDMGRDEHATERVCMKHVRICDENGALTQRSKKHTSDFVLTVP